MRDLINRLRDIAVRNQLVQNTSLYSEAADALEAKDKEIAQLKEHDEALHIVCIERAKYKLLCDQLADALEYAEAGSFKLDVERKIEYALSAWRAIK